MFDTQYGCVYVIVTHNICLVSLFPHTVWLCESEGKEPTVCCQHGDIKKGYLAEAGGPEHIGLQQE